MIYFFTKYSIRAGSSRVRSFEYKDFFKDAGIEVVYYPLFDNFYLFLNNKNYVLAKTLYSVYSYVRRLLVLLFTRFNQDDIFIVEKELFPKVNERLESFFLRRNKYFLDFDDALFLYNDFTFRSKFYSLISSAAGVMVCNKFLQESAIKLGAKSTILLPSCVRTDVVSKVDFDTYLSREFFTVGWVGSPSTTKYVVDVVDLLVDFKRRHKDVKIVLVGADERSFSQNVRTEIEFLNFDLSNVYKVIEMFAVGIMPLRRSDWERGKCAYKLIQYWACGVPVISSNFGLNAELVVDRSNGLLFDNDEEFINSLELIYADRRIGFVMGDRGHDLVIKSLSYEVNFVRMLDFIKG